MYTLEDYLAVDPWEALIRIINFERGVQLEPNLTELVNQQALGNKRLEVTLDARRSASPVGVLPPLENLTFTLKRLYFTDVFKGNYQYNDLPLPFNTSDILKRLSASANVAFDLDDVYHEEYTEYPSSPIELKAHPLSLRWEGTLPITVVNGMQDNLTAINNTEVPEAIIYPNGDEFRAQGYYYLNPFDFSEYREHLRPLGQYENTIDGDRLAVIISDVSGEEWVCSEAPHPRNIAMNVEDEVAKYSVLYNGAATERYTARTDFRNVVILDINKDLSTGLLGAVRLHYN